MIRIMRMKGFREPRIETAGAITVHPPASEALLDPSGKDGAWLKRIAEHPDIRRQIAERRALNERLDAVLCRLPRPDISLEVAIAKGAVTEEQVADLYESLTPLLRNGSEYQRLALYLPFEFLPGADRTPLSPALEQAAVAFTDAYKEAWHRLLNVHDVRANFVDGDVLEIEQREADLPRVVKAAHLIPELVLHGMMTVDESLALMEETPDDILRKNVAEAMAVLADRGLLRSGDIARIEDSPDPAVNRLGEQIRESGITKANDERPIPEMSAAAMNERLRAEAARIATADFGDASPNRKAWLQKEGLRNAAEAAGNDIASAIGAHAADGKEIERLAAPNADPLARRALVDGIRKAVEAAAHADPERGRALYAAHRATLDALWADADPELCDALSTTLCRLHGLGAVGDDDLKARKIAIPALAGPASKNLERMAHELGDIKDAVAAIERDAELSKLVYPVILVYGSRIKGYGAETADLDVGIFVRPGVPKGSGARMRAALQTIFAHEKIHASEVVEFWLDETEDGLRIHDDADDTGAIVGTSSWTHILFGAAWEGNAGVVSDLRKNILTPYFRDRAERSLYLEELERDALQYRLLHKGYARFMPSYGGIHTPHADAIDGASTFWDSGYRQTATKLYASRVFLPNISTEK